jgi:hypothetical protein
MSSLSSVSGSTSASYAAQVAQTSAFERSLYNLGTAVQNGDMTSAGSILTALIQANPQYATTSSASGGSAQSQDPLNQDFQNLASAISSNQPDAAKTAWTQLKNDLAKAGITNISSGTDLAAQAVAQNEVSMQQALLTSLFGSGTNSTSGSPNLATLLGGSTDTTDSTSSSPDLASLLGGTSSSDTSTSTDPLTAALNNWLMYQSDGTASAPTGSSSTTNGLDTVA